MTIDRIDPLLQGNERATLNAFLDWHRETLAVKCEGLTAEQLRLESMPPSSLSLLGLVRHMAEVERTWFRRVLAGESISLVYSESGDYQVAYDAVGADVDEAFMNWRTEIEHSHEIEARAPHLETTGYHQKWDEQVSLRWEGIDGSTGE